MKTLLKRLKWTNNSKTGNLACKQVMAGIPVIALILLLNSVAAIPVSAEESATANSEQANENEQKSTGNQAKKGLKIFDLKLDDSGKTTQNIDTTQFNESAGAADAGNSNAKSASETNTSKSLEKDNRTTAEKLEDLKKDVLDVNRDLFILEEDLLFPASTQVAVYFSIDVGYFFSLDNVKLKIDDKQVTHYLYTKKDVDALYRGAIQKLHLGNVSTGEHELVAIVIGIGPHEREYRKAVTFKFTKETEAKALEIQIRDDEGKLQPRLSVVEW